MNRLQIARNLVSGLAPYLSLALTGAVIFASKQWVFSKSKLEISADGPFWAGMVTSYLYLILMAIRGSPRLLAVPYSTAILLLLTAAFGPKGPVQRLPMAAVDFVAGVAVFGVAGLILTNVVGNLFSYRGVANGLLVDRLIYLLSETESSPLRWGELPFRLHLAQLVEHIATILDRDVARLWRSRDAGLNVWLDERIRLISAHVRSLKKWLITPRPDTRDQFLGKLRDILICIADDNWDGIPHEETGAAPAETQWRQRIWRVFSVLATALTPIVAVWTLQKVGVIMNEPTRTYAYFGAFAWLAVTFITALDPLYAAKLEAIKSVLPLVGSSNKKD